MFEHRVSEGGEAAFLIIRLRYVSGMKAIRKLGGTECAIQQLLAIAIAPAANQDWQNSNEVLMDIFHVFPLVVTQAVGESVDQMALTGRAIGKDCFEQELFVVGLPECFADRPELYLIVCPFRYRFERALGSVTQDVKRPGLIQGVRNVMLLTFAWDTGMVLLLTC